MINMNTRVLLYAILNLLLPITASAVFADTGKDDSGASWFKWGNANSSVNIDAQTAQRLGIKVEPARKQSFDSSIKTIGKIEILPDQQVDVTAPLASKLVKLLVKPGSKVRRGQPVAVASEPELLELHVSSINKQASALAALQKAQADLSKAAYNLEHQRLLLGSQAKLKTTSSQLTSSKNQTLFIQAESEVGRTFFDLPLRELPNSQLSVAEAQTQLKPTQNREVLEALAQLKRAQASVEIAQSQLQLGNTIYNNRLQQLTTSANPRGLVTITAPISGTVAERSVSLNQLSYSSSDKLITILGDGRVFAVANIYEKGDSKVKNGQQVKIKVASLPNKTFEGRITQIDTFVQAKTRVVPVQVEIKNLDGSLKPGMVAELEVIADKTASLLMIPSTAIVNANGEKVVYVQNGNAFEAVKATFGQSFGDMVEVKTGLVDGNLVVTQRANQLYAQSLQDIKKKRQNYEEEIQVKTRIFSIILTSTIIIGWLILTMNTEDKS
ncbi:hypothetical protein NIES2101_02190 [Calothrix sp. HK-06]|nr:hypothetical protein NIES2101_02190 [Calothrix sp. HK-06]